MSLKKIKKAFRILREDGLSSLKAAFYRYADYQRIDREYAEWIARHDTLTDAVRGSLKKAADALPNKPKISVVMPVYNVEERFLREALESVRRQIYTNWELCLADDNSPDPHVRRVIEEYLAEDDRIKAVFRETNGHISAASNSALELAIGEFTALMDHDDVLAEDALFQVARVINKFPETLFIYSDEDKIDADGRRFRPTFKPDFSPELFESLNMVTHLCVFKTALLREIGGFRVGLEGSQDYDLSLRYIDHIDPAAIVHIPHVLYHWRSIPGSVALDPEEKSYAHDNARRALDDHFVRINVKARSVRGVNQMHRTVYDLPRPHPSVELVIDSENGGMPTSLEPAAAEYGNAVISFAGNSGRRFERLNNAAKRSRADILLFISGDTVAVSPNFIAEMAVRAVKKGVGAAGAKVVDTKDRIWSGGYLFSDSGVMVHFNKGRRKSDHGYFARLAVDQNLSAVSVDCMAIRRDIFMAADGFDANAFPEFFADIDLCQRLVRKGYGIVWTPWAEISVEPREMQDVSNELAELNSRWKERFAKEPFYNPNLAFPGGDGDFFASPPRAKRFDA